MNKYRPHLFVIPEDDANRQLANGFVNHSRIQDRNIQVLPVAGGWRKALEKLEDEYFLLLNNNCNGRVVVLIDCDNQIKRITEALDRVPASIKDRVFILGTLDEPEALKKDLSKSFEAIGGEVAEDCGKEDTPIWAHPQLSHNRDEVARLSEDVIPILLSS